MNIPTPFFFFFFFFLSNGDGNSLPPLSPKDNELTDPSFKTDETHSCKTPDRQAKKKKRERKKDLFHQLELFCTSVRFKISPLTPGGMTQENIGHDMRDYHTCLFP